MARIVLIDDEEEVSAVFRRILEIENHEVFIASSAEEGLELMGRINPQLLITDILMPDKEGIETILEVKRDFPDTIILAVSGGGLIQPESYLNLARKAGAHATMEKPFNPQHFLSLVRQLLELKTNNEVLPAC